MSVPFLDIIGGVTDVSNQLLKLYQIRRDGTFFEQQAFLTRLHEYQAENATLRATKREVLLAKLGEDRAEADHHRDIEFQLANARLQVGLLRELRADAQIAQNAPFGFDPDYLRNIVRETTNAGAKPALLIAPFFNDELSMEQADHGPPEFRIAIRRSWLKTPWASDVALLDGLLTRPLRNTDVDVLMIRQALRDFPVILIHGEIQRQNRAWCSISSWNIVPQRTSEAVNIHLPPLPFPEKTPDGRERIEFEDGLGWAVAVTAGVLAEWFHVTRTGRTPRLHTSLAPTGFPLREIGPSLAAAYEVAMADGAIDVISGQANQALLLADSGYEEAALEILLTVDTNLEEGVQISSADARDLLRRLAASAKSLGDTALADRMQQRLEKESQRFLMRFLNLPETAGD